MHNEDPRQTYLGSEQHTLDQILNTLDQIRKKPHNLDHFFKIYEQQIKIRKRPELVSLLLQYPSLIKQIIKCCLQPQLIKIQNKSWPFYARDILIQNGAIINSLFYENTACLFDFLNQQPNQTVFGYFSEIIKMKVLNRQDMIVYQKKLLLFLKQNKSILDLCLLKSYNPEIFKFLFQCITVPDENDMPFKSQIMSLLFNKIFEESFRLNYSQNVYDMMDSLTENTNDLSTNLISIIIKNVQQKYLALAIQTIKQYTQKKQMTQDQEQIAEYYLLILCNVIKFYKKLLNEKNQKKINNNCMNSLEISVIQIISNIESLSVVLKINSKQRRFSTGEDILPVKFIKYYYIKLVRIVLQLDANLVLNNYDMTKGLLNLIQKFFNLNKWNNMLHLQIQKIVELLINKYQNYICYQQRYIGKQGFLCFLIENFRSRYFLFINSNNMSTYGGTHIMYNMAKNISLKLIQSQKFRQLMDKFQPWQRFITEDLKKYEQQLDKPLGDQSNYIANKKQPSNSVKQILNKLQLDNLINQFSDLQNEQNPKTNPKIVDYKFDWIYNK